MYRLDWLEQLKLGDAEIPARKGLGGVSAAVWKIGFTSFLTDISSEMVNSLLPVYLMLYLHTTPIQYGAVDGLYNGFAVAGLSIVGGLVADRKHAHKQIAGIGYALSAICKLGLLASGAIWGWILAIVALDRIGKGIRTAPRDAMISLHTRRADYSTAFAVHRMMDAGGTLLGPIIAFGLLFYLPHAYDVVWVTSFVFAVIGLAVLSLFVPAPDRTELTSVVQPSAASALRLFSSRQFLVLSCCGLLLSISTISDGFLYLQLQRKAGMTSGFFPLYYVITATFYMLFSVPAGRIADRYGRRLTFLAGYLVLLTSYLVLGTRSQLGPVLQAAVLCLLGVYYAASEGVLMAMASTVIPAVMRTTGLALLATFIGIGKLGSALLFGGIWQSRDPNEAVWVFTGLLLAALLVSAAALNAYGYEQFES
jgi:MFS family permease